MKYSPVPSTSFDLCKLLHPTVWEEMHLQENTLFDLDKVTQNVAQYHLHRMTYAAANFEFALFNGLGGDVFTRKYII